MKEGDIIEWRGANKTIRGKVIKDEKVILSVSWTMGASFLSRISVTQDLQNSLRHEVDWNGHRNTQRAGSVG